MPLTPTRLTAALTAQLLHTPIAQLHLCHFSPPATGLVHRPVSPRASLQPRARDTSEVRANRAVHAARAVQAECSHLQDSVATTLGRLAAARARLMTACQDNSRLHGRIGAALEGIISCMREGRSLSTPSAKSTPLQTAPPPEAPSPAGLHPYASSPLVGSVRLLPGTFLGRVSPLLCGLGGSWLYHLRILSTARYKRAMMWYAAEGPVRLMSAEACVCMPLCHKRSQGP